MTNYEIRVTQVTRDYYRLEAKDEKDAEAQLWTALRTGIFGNVALNDTNDCSPTIDYTVQVSPEGEVII
tara:strand:+ start:2351 stop:2557 length:207 start_codon:yes stop_codon:yes gene_type:complete